LHFNDKNEEEDEVKSKAPAKSMDADGNKDRVDDKIQDPPLNMSSSPFIISILSSFLNASSTFEHTIRNGATRPPNTTKTMSPLEDFSGKLGSCPHK
jgi:hypothetical protein